MITLILLAVILAVLPQELIDLLTPILVLGITQLVRVFKPKIPGWLVLGIVGLLSAGIAWVTTALIDPGGSWLTQFLLGLVSIALVELKKQLGQGNDKSPGYNARKSN